MKILFSVYSENRETRNIEHKESIWVHTDWSIQKIEEHIALYNGFRSQIMIGENLSFFDYYCFFADYNDLIGKIKTIPQNAVCSKNVRAPSVFRVSKFNPGNADSPKFPNNQQRYIYNLSRYECGASSFEAFIYWSSEHPLEMIFIAGIVYDFSKWLFVKFLKLLGVKKGNSSNIFRPVVLNTKRLYKNFSKLTRIDAKDCQIIKFNRLNVGVFHVKIRTVTNKIFKVKCYANGKVESFEEVN